MQKPEQRVRKNFGNIAMCKSEITRVYFSHDQDARGDDKIKEMFFDFRKIANDIDLAELKALASISCYSIYWSIIEFMHRNSFHTKDIELIADDLRIEPAYVEKILTEYDLFRKENDEFISDRVIANLSKQKQKSETKQRAAQVRWTMSFYNKVYKAEFGITPVLSDEEIENLIRYSNEIENFKEILPDILYTLNFIEVSKDMKFNPRSNWLLSKTNLAKVLHGEFGKLRHKKTAKEIKAEKLAHQQAKEKEQAPEIDIESVKTRKQALDTLVEYSRYFHINNKFIINNDAKPLLKMFDITADEVKERKIQEIMSRKI